jgi:3-deoxy-manno-octulosonate cytidylyltransferase (CMP-KDO synthetase)
MANFAVVIPARFKSSRFPGKPLVDLCGKPMIQRVWERCCQAVGADKVYVATDDERIKACIEQFNGKVVMTSSDCLTGTDRIAEANKTLQCDFLVNVQGDEPLIDPEHIKLVVKKFKETGNVTNAMCEITSESEFRSLTVPKVACSKTGKLLYMSRAGIPLTKDGEFRFGFKQVCIYAFSKEQLEFFSGFNQKSLNENVEDIEILRFLENDYTVDMVKVSAGSLAIDILEDVEKVTKVLETN